MNYKNLLVVSLLCAMGLSYTELTLLNCPAQFNITASNLTMDGGGISLGSLIYGGFQSQTSINRVQSIVITGNTADLGAYISELMIPYLIFGVLFIAVFIAIVILCLFDKSCPPCECLRRDYNVKPYTKPELRVVMVLTLIFSIGVLVTCLISFSFIPAMKRNLSLTSCSIYLAIDSALNGDGTWGGFVNLRNQIGNITNLLASAVTKIQIYFPGDSWLQDTMVSMRQANLNIYSNYKDSQMFTPNPTTTATAANAGQSTPMIDSLFIRNGLGPNATANAMLTDIDSGLRTTAKLSNQAYDIQASAQILTGSINTILNNSANSQNILLMYIYQLGVMSTEYNSFATAYFTKYFSTGLGVFQGVFAFALTGSLLILLGLVSTHIFDLLICRRMVHLGWTIFGLSYIGIIAVTFVVFSLGSVGYTFCNYFKVMLSTQAQYSRLNSAYSQNAFGRLDACLFGNGNSLQKFSIAQEMLTVTTLFTNIQTYYAYTNQLNNQYADTTISTGKISSWITIVNRYRLGQLVDFSPAVTTDDNPNYAINSLNLYTFQGGGVPTGSKDVWVWDSSLCTNPTQIVYAAGFNPGTTLSTSNVTCMSFNQKLSINFANSWSVSDFTSRYVQIRQGFPDAYRQIALYGPTLIAYRDSRLNLFQGISDSLSSILSQNNNFNTLLTGFKSRVDQFYSSVSTLNNLITNPLDGLITSSNCRTLGDKMRFTYNVFCVNFMAQIVKLCFCSLALLVLMFGGVVVGSKFGIMYAEIEKEERVNQPAGEFVSEKDIHVEQHDSATSSNSEDD